MTEDSVKTIRMVIVDDHSLVRDGLKARLSVVAGLQVVGEAGGGIEALRLAELLAPDLMLVDVGMRGMNGIELASALRERYPGIRVLMLSSACLTTANTCSAPSAREHAAMC
jgi:two-component system, NarL family, nitrate/nitrite response regulator NarL